MRMSVRLAFPYDLIISGSLIGTEVGGLPGSKVMELQRLPVPGEPDAAVMVVEVPHGLTLTYTPDPL